MTTLYDRRDEVRLFVNEHRAHLGTYARPQVSFLAYADRYGDGHAWTTNMLVPCSIASYFLDEFDDLVIEPGKINCTSARGEPYYIIGDIKDFIVALSDETCTADTLTYCVFASGSPQDLHILRASEIREIQDTFRPSAYVFQYKEPDAH